VFCNYINNFFLYTLHFLKIIHTRKKMYNKYKNMWTNVGIDNCNKHSQQNEPSNKCNIETPLNQQETPTNENNPDPDATENNNKQLVIVYDNNNIIPQTNEIKIEKETICDTVDNKKTNGNRKLKRKINKINYNNLI